MAEFDDKLSAILGDSEAMSQIVSIAKALTSATGNNSEESAEPSETPDGTASTWDSGSAQTENPLEGFQALAAPETPSSSGGEESSMDWGSILGLLGNLSGGGGSSNPLGMLSELDPRMIQTALRLFSEYSATDDRKIALLSSLKPFLKPERYAKVDKAVQIAKLSRVIRVAFQLFKKDGEGGDSV